MDRWQLVCGENRIMNEFVQEYIVEHFGADPVDPVLAQSEALTAFWRVQGFTFNESDEDNDFIIPDHIQAAMK
ncbi:hypothetical protein A8990_1813 [Paenibacillus taihuensis]|uniref:Uncharacterized protein n=1 Tax=Paenibacillus taihuensis TaxID=1156355 RepID=A0A3D9Q1X5_9BACL|nr:hypothetical protein [Paenibacillus taihuensis]REE54713.1 hypothetical protein A8990_1813 [Paenibacillus taihuensis]